ncbi:ATP-dependent DNA helicase II subunit 1 [Endocarpon pusillum]|uniref:ATP-dependent DNA helicase II subunit 1 n=1 Tax=Endocarpon pusillum TaxID=364733 RepID=A0A8H7ALK1_9EURO|nr:ATP-dependent DNA helicase II subunit 1 [Endocarpon pusillum]
MNEEESRRNGDEDEEEEVDETGYKTVKDALLFAIEISDSMLTTPPPSSSKNADTLSPAFAALKCAYHLMQQRIISDPKAMMGILLYGTEASKFYGEDETTRGGLSYPHCYLLTDLDVPEAEDVKTLKRLVEDESAESDILKPSKEPVSMANVLFCANQIFTTRAANFSSRRLFIVTNNDNPHSTDKALRSSAAVRAKDLYDLGVVIELFAISSASHTFDTSVFYDDIIYRSSPVDPDAPAYNPSTLSVPDQELKTGYVDGITLLNSLLSSISSKSTPRRTLFSSVPLELAPGFRISVKGYLLYKRQEPARSCYVYLGTDRPQIARGSTTQMADDTARTVEKFEIRKAYTFGGEQISFSPDEIKTLRNFGEPVIRIIGFKPVEMLPSWANIKQSTFLYPSDDDYVGSTRVFSALYSKLLKSKLMGLVWFIARRNAAPVMAALIPTLASDENLSGPQSGVSPTGCPQGLHLVPLPFADDIRQNPPMAHETPLRAPDSLIDAMRPIIGQLTLPKGMYDPERYPNPALQWHYRILQALALDEDLPEKPEDKTIPKYRQIDKRVGNEVTDWGKELERAYREHKISNPNDTTMPVKRERPAAHGDAAASKRPKAEPGVMPDDAEIRKLWEKGQVSKMTVPHLKDWLGAKKLPLTGKKADLVERVEEWFESR